MLPVDNVITDGKVGDMLKDSSLVAKAKINTVGDEIPDGFAGVDIGPKTIEKINNIYFSGIKGVGMTALALYVRDMGYKVQGCDVSDNFVTQEVLEKKGIRLDNGFSENSITPPLIKP